MQRVYMRERPDAVSVCMYASSNSMSFLEIQDPTKRMALVDEYVKSMKTVRQRNMVNRVMKLAIGEELQTLFHPIISTTEQASERTAEELVPVKKALEDIDGTLKAQRRTIPPPPPPSSPSENDLTFGIHVTGHDMGNSIVHIEGNTIPSSQWFDSVDIVQETATSTVYQRILFCIQRNRCTD